MPQNNIFSKLPFWPNIQEILFSKVKIELWPWILVIFFVLTKHTPYLILADLPSYLKHSTLIKLWFSSSIVVWIINDDLLFCERNIANELKSELKHSYGQNRPNACQILQLISKFQVWPPCLTGPVDQKATLDRSHTV